MNVIDLQLIFHNTWLFERRLKARKLNVLSSISTFPHKNRLVFGYPPTSKVPHEHYLSSARFPEVVNIAVLPSQMRHQARALLAFTKSCG